eukprot:7310409-Pyramimonas_sp.AAC.1
MDHASDDAKRVHHEEVGRLRETLSREFDIVKSHRALVEIGLPNIIDDAPAIVACNAIRAAVSVRRTIPRSTVHSRRAQAFGD